MPSSESKESAADPGSTGADGAGGRLTPGTVVAERYRIAEFLAEGGMGAVYRAEHLHMRKSFALKVLHRTLASNPEAVARFEREAIAAGNIDHPNVACATDFGRLPDGSFFLVLEFVRGRSLRDVIEGGALEPARAIKIMRGIVAGVSAAHCKGIVHRDLKPENIMLVDHDGDADFVKVLDFGIAKVDPSSPAGPERSGAPLTAIGSVIGTPEYMAPEQALGETIDARSDLYSLGVIFYELLAGACPFVGPAVSVLQRHLREEPPPFSEGLIAQLDSRVVSIVPKLLAKRPDDRFESASDLAAALAEVAAPPRGVAIAGSGPRQRTTSAIEAWCHRVAGAVARLRPQARIGLVIATGIAVVLLVLFLRDGDDGGEATAPRLPGASEVQAPPALEGPTSMSARAVDSTPVVLPPPPEAQGSARMAAQGPGASGSARQSSGSRGTAPRRTGPGGSTSPRPASGSNEWDKMRARPNMTIKSKWKSVIVGLAGIVIACGGSTGNVATRGDGGADDASADGLPASGSNGGAIATDASLSPEVFASSGGGGASSGAIGPSGSCLGLGSGCATSGDCCSADCANGECVYPACTSDGAPCSANGNCCSQTCTGGTCATLNATCRTLGNGCTISGQCCSGLCTNGACEPSSFCGQGGDACASSADCCTGTCTIATGKTLGTCGASPPSGPANCGVVDGQLCGGTSTSGHGAAPEGGLPACGGSCCSRACAPWGPSGVLVCQPASGCRVVGDLCAKDADCCGSAGLPGGSGMPVTCVITSPSTVGVCRNPMGCKPDGDVCKLKTMSCNSSCDCCSGNCETEDTCKQDNVGVPRCAPAQCVAAGGACASSASCCGGAPCVPNTAGGAAPQFVCSGTACVPACSQCTNNADCCPGTSCMTQSGSSVGVCGPCGPGDAGLPGNEGGSGSGGGSSGGGGSGPSCALYGQVCTSATECCNGVPCDGRCEYPIQ